jgi:hypothetical protein
VRFGPETIRHDVARHDLPDWDSGQKPAFLSSAHRLSCTSCGTLKCHNAVAYGPLADHFKAQGIDFLREHTVLESFGKN